MPCSNCNSKRHSTEKCLLGRTKESNLYLPEEINKAFDYWMNKNMCRKVGGRIPTITIKELSYLLSLARKNVIRKNEKIPEMGQWMMDMCFDEIRRKLELRRRGRK